jgi:hypothetical protein
VLDDRVNGPGRFSAPRCERWVFDYFATLLARRLALPSLDERERTGMTRLLHGVQAFPRIVRDLRVCVSWRGGFDPSLRENWFSIGYTCEEVRFQMGHTRLEYFARSNQLFVMHEHLEGEARERFLDSWIEEFEELADAALSIHVEDLSNGFEVDKPPLSEFWDKRVRIISDMFE